MCIYIYVYVICTWGLTELAIGAQRTAGEGRTVLGRPNPKSEKIRDYNLNKKAGKRSTLRRGHGTVVFALIPAGFYPGDVRVYCDITYTGL